MVKFLISVVTAGGWVELKVSARTVREARAFAMRHPGAIEIAHVGIDEG